MKGFYLRLRGKEVFVKTHYTNKCEGLARKILRKFNLPENPDTVREVLYLIRKANCEIRTLSTGREYYEIFGDNFGGCGTFVDDGNTIIVEVN